MDDNYLTHQEAFQNMSTVNSEVYDDGTIMFEPDFSANIAERKKKKSIWYRISHASPTEYIIIIIICLIIIISLSIALGNAGCLSNTSAKDAANANSQNADEETHELDKECLYRLIRLPESILPSVYYIHLEPNISSGVKPHFTGWTRIQASCVQSTNYVVLHSKDLLLKSITITGKTLGELKVTFRICSQLEQVYIEVDQQIPQGEDITIKIYFEGDIKVALDGFYLSNYEKNSGSDKLYLATTHMEPTSARKAFPCFDEPALKANFSLEILRDADQITLFNMPLTNSVEQSGSLFLDRYEMSVKMSTYLVAFMVLPKDYQSVADTSPNGKVKIGVYVPSDMLSSAAFAVNVTKKVLPFFEDFFSQSYPLPKLDMIGIPDFGAGAMENWGLITYRFTALLFSPEDGQVQNAQSVAEVISHEIAHQWFGNIVTMKWWNDLWLNEGFATFTQYMAADYFNPKWQMMDQFYLTAYQQALEFDSLLHSHPIPIPVEDPVEIESLFDDISYFKSASLLRMLESVVGQTSLKEGLKIYLQRFRFKNAASDDLWAAITEGYQKTNKKTPAPPDSPLQDLKKMMSTWLNQMNYPTVTATLVTPTTFRLDQERYLAFKDSVNLFQAEYESPFNYLWSVPVKYITDSEPVPKLIWLDLKKSQTYTLNKPAKWIKINYEQTGFYISNYDGKLWQALIQQLLTNHTVFNGSDRAGLIHDAFNLVRSGDLNVTVAMDMISYLVNETEYAPWYTAYMQLTDVRKMISRDGDMDKLLKERMQAIVKPVLQRFVQTKMSWYDKSLTHMQILTRNTVFKFAVHFEEASAVEESIKLFDEYKKTLKVKDPNLKSIVFFSAVHFGPTENWDFLWQRYTVVTDPQEKRVIRRALTATRNSEQISRLLGYTFHPKLIRPQDAVSVILDLSSNPIGRDLAWIFMRRFWRFFHQQYASQAFLMAELVKIGNTFATEFDYKTCEEFFKSNNLGAGTRSSKQVLEHIQSNIFWQKRNYVQIGKWLKRNTT